MRKLQDLQISDKQLEILCKTSCDSCTHACLMKLAPGVLDLLSAWYSVLVLVMYVVIGIIFMDQ